MNRGNDEEKKTDAEQERIQFRIHAGGGTDRCPIDIFLLRNMNSSGLSPTRDKEDILDQAQEAVDLMNRRNESAVQEQ